MKKLLQRIARSWSRSKLLGNQAYNVPPSVSSFITEANKCIPLPYLVRPDFNARSVALLFDKELVARVTYELIELDEHATLEYLVESFKEHCGYNSPEV